MMFCYQYKALFKKAKLKTLSNVATTPHRWAFPSTKVLSATANRTFAVTSFGAWTRRMKWCIKKELYWLDKKAIRWQSFCLLFLLFRKSKVAARAKHQAGDINVPRWAKTNLTFKTHQRSKIYIPTETMGTRKKDQPAILCCLTPLRS